MSPACIPSHRPTTYLCLSIPRNRRPPCDPDHRCHRIRRLPLVSEGRPSQPSPLSLPAFSTPLPGPPPPSSLASPLSTLPLCETTASAHRSDTSRSHFPSSTPFPLFPCSGAAPTRAPRGGALRPEPNPARDARKGAAPFSRFLCHLLRFPREVKPFLGPKKRGKKITARPNTCDFDSSYSHEFPLASGSFPASDPPLLRLLAADRSHMGV